MEEFAVLYREIYTMPESAAKVDAIKDAIRMADQANENIYSHKFRKMLIDDAAYSGNYSDVRDGLTAISWIISDLDRNNEAVGMAIIDKYQWIARWIALCPEIPKENILRLLDDLKKRFTDAGQGLRGYYEALLAYGIETDDSEIADMAYEEYSKGKKDYFVDCDACIACRKIKYQRYKGNLNEALKIAKIYQKTSCNQNPKTAYNDIIGIAAETGQVHLEVLPEIQKEAYRLIRSRPGNADYFGGHFLYFAQLEPLEGLKLYKKYIKWGHGRVLLPREQMFFNMGAAVLMKVLGDKRFKADIPQDAAVYKESNSYKASELAEYHYDKALVNIKAFDKRNGTDFYMNRFNRILNI